MGVPGRQEEKNEGYLYLRTWHSVGGVDYRHSQRLIGSMVGLLTVALCVSL